MDAGFTAFLREQEVSSFHPSLGTDCSAGGLGRARVSCSLWAAAVPPAHSPNYYTNPISHFFPHPTTALHWKGDNISPSGEATKLKQTQSPCMQQAQVSSPIALLSPFPFFAASVSEQPQSLQEERISTLLIPSRASSASKGSGKAPSLSPLLHKSPLPKQNPTTKLMLCLHKPSSQPGKLEGSIPSQDHWYVGALSA